MKNSSRKPRLSISLFPVTRCLALCWGQLQNIVTFRNMVAGVCCTKWQAKPAVKRCLSDRHLERFQTLLVHPPSSQAKRCAERSQQSKRCTKPGWSETVSALKREIKNHNCARPTSAMIWRTEFRSPFPRLWPQATCGVSMSPPFLCIFLRLKGHQSWAPSLSKRG